MDVTVSKWGHSLAVRIPKRIADSFNVHDGSKLNMRLAKKAGHAMLIIEPTAPTLEDLLAQVTPENSYTLMDWGQPQGNEIF